MAQIDAQHEKAEKYLNKTLDTPLIRFMFEQLANNGCVLNKEHIQLVKCEPTRAGGFAPGHGIVLCENQIMSRQHLEDTLAHELVHSYDHCTVKMDWNNIDHLACSEIRAQTLSGECKLSREFYRGKIGLAKHFQQCVKRRSVLGVKQVFEDGAEEAVNRVWSRCFPDTSPFDEIY
ncbi:peptidase M76 [Gorgonomyces haynaldii]|nr:peptidase M76 [Gorgonomyces haynaldii]